MIITLRMTQTKTEPTPQIVQLPQQNVPAQQLPSNPAAPAQLPPNPALTNSDTGMSFEAAAIPKEFQRGPVEQKPLSPDGIISSLMKDTPACHDEYKEHCTKNRFLAEHPLACLRSKKEQLSRACFNQLAAVRDRFHQECGDDIKRFCPNEASYFVCLKKRLSELSPSCKNNIAKSSRQ
ncbi:hypothetical protein Bdt_2811 [Bdellovibrio bacteriovorus str. Tiberius]|uniref:Uncharacterized protein n=1 Tax=Bdellovibrio bacteriovorus str. Tiberius TaxID=1069642 RepID=K7ZGH7_BDEBC|nr:hypothetical protein Bdt_2811 [Bdellovibrio bacteriovorus str. Tiberius]